VSRPVLVGTSTARGRAKKRLEKNLTRKGDRCRLLIVMPHPRVVLPGGKLGLAEERTAEEAKCPK
jgi:hypothetical protein